jgi:hypothetical protein
MMVEFCLNPKKWVFCVRRKRKELFTTKHTKSHGAWAKEADSLKLTPFWDDLGGSGIHGEGVEEIAKTAKIGNRRN